MHKKLQKNCLSFLQLMLGHEKLGYFLTKKFNIILKGKKKN